MPRLEVINTQTKCSSSCVKAAGLIATPPPPPMHRCHETAGITSARSRITPGVLAYDPGMHRVQTEAPAVSPHTRQGRGERTAGVSVLEGGAADFG